MIRISHQVTIMDVEKAIALVSAAGIELTDRRRNSNDGTGVYTGGPRLAFW